MGRPSKLTPEVTKRLTEAIRAGNYYEAACGYAGIGYSTFRDAVNIYKTRKWLRTRERVLRRDEYMCRECRRYGRTTPATTVHHIYPLEQYPEWKWATWNMLSLCDACHNKMHNRETGELSELGKQWTDRTSPPP